VITFGSVSDFNESIKTRSTASLIAPVAKDDIRCTRVDSGNFNPVFRSVDPQHPT